MSDHGLSAGSSQVGVVGRDDDAHALGAAAVQVAETAGHMVMHVKCNAQNK